MTRHIAILDHTPVVSNIRGPWATQAGSHRMGTRRPSWTVRHDSWVTGRTNSRYADDLAASVLAQKHIPLLHNSRCRLGCVALLFLLLTSCGPDLPCARYDDAARPDERVMLDDLATVFTDLGYEEPCCPVHFCRAGEPCQRVIEYCGAVKMSGDECKQVWVDASRERCTDPARTAAHEWLHSQGYMHGKDMDEAQGRILGEYMGRNDA